MARFLTLKPDRRFYVQVIFWIGYFLFEWLSWGSFQNNYWGSFYWSVLNLPILMLAGYWHLRVTVRQYLLKGRTTGAWINVIGGFLVFGLISRIVNQLFYYPYFYPASMQKSVLYWPKLLGESMHVQVVAALFVAIDLVWHSLRQQQLSETYRREKLAAEYRLLQSQVQPHFLFNTLNNLVSVSLHQPARMPNLLQQLADLMSYQLHESHRPKVPLKKELGYLMDYIALEKIRYGERLDVQTNFDDGSDLGQLMVPPMLLLPFVENAFKHGAAQTESACWIQLHLTQSGNRLVFSVENSVPDEGPAAEKSGLGLSNLKKRLDILFPDNYELVTMNEEGQFLAVLKFTPEPQDQRSGSETDELALSKQPLPVS